MSRSAVRVRSWALLFFAYLPRILDIEKSPESDSGDLYTSPHSNAGGGVLANRFRFVRANAARQHVSGRLIGGEIASFRYLVHVS